MSNLVLRALKGAELTHAEVDGNFSKSHPALQSIIKSAIHAFNNNCRTRGVMSAPPTITVGTATVPSGFDRSYVFGAAGAPFVSNGGDPLTVSGITTFPSTTPNSTKIPHSWRVDTILDGDAVSFLLSSDDANGYRFIVDGRYVSLTGSVSATGAERYYTLTFAQRDRYRITVEGSEGHVFGQARTKTVDRLIYPAELVGGPRVFFVGDSNADLYGYDLKGDNYALCLADHLGVRDIVVNPIGTTGLWRSTGGNNYLQRANDWLASPGGFDAVIFQMSWNDYNYGSGATAAQMKTQAAALISGIRAVNKYAPIIFVGVMSWDLTGYEAGLTEHENAVAEAVSDAVTAGDPFVGFIPSVSNTAEEIFMPSAPGSAAIYVNGSIDHMNPAGNWYAGRWLAGKLLVKLVEMAGVNMPALLPRQ